MDEILYACLALSSLALTGAAVPLLLAARSTVVKAGEALDGVNQELPLLLANLRHASEDARHSAELLKGTALRLNSTGTMALAALQVVKAAAEAFIQRRQQKRAASSKEKHHEQQ